MVVPVSSIQVGLAVEGRNKLKRQLSKTFFNHPVYLTSDVRCALKHLISPLVQAFAGGLGCNGGGSVHFRTNA